MPDTATAPAAPQTAAASRMPHKPPTDHQQRIEDTVDRILAAVTAPGPAAGLAPGDPAADAS